MKRVVYIFFWGGDDIYFRFCYGSTTERGGTQQFVCSTEIISFGMVLKKALYKQNNISRKKNGPL